MPPAAEGSLAQAANAGSAAAGTPSVFGWAPETRFIAPASGHAFPRDFPTCAPKAPWPCQPFGRCPGFAVLVSLVFYSRPVLPGRGVLNNRSGLGNMSVSESSYRKRPGGGAALGAVAPAMPEVPGTAAVLAAVAALTTGWLASGALGPLAMPLRSGLGWLGWAIMVAAGWPAGQPLRPLTRPVAASLVGVLAALVLLAARSDAAGVLGTAVGAAALASWRKGADRRAMLLVAWALGVLGIYRAAVLSIPAVWLGAEQLARGLGHFAAAVAGRPVALGPAYAGLDLLLAMFCVYLGWVWEGGRPWWRRAATGLVCMAGVHLGYLLVLASSAELRAALPVPQLPAVQTRYIPPPWHWSDLLRAAVPWNLPLLAAAGHLAVMALWFRWTAWRVPATTASAGFLRWAPWLRQSPVGWASPAVAAAVLAMLVAWTSPVGTLAGKSVLALDLPSVDWSVPESGRFGRAAGEGFGTLPRLVESLGAGFRRSRDLSEADLATADVLVVLPPARPLPSELIQRIWHYVRSGGAVLVVAEPSVHEGELSSLFADLLAPASIRVRFDVATAVCAHWEDSLQAAPHPAIVGLSWGRNRLGLGQAASLEIAWPARPLLVGRFGWSDPGVDALLTGRHRLEPGERLGELVLAAEQPAGRGTVVVLADSRPLTNEGIPYSYEFVGRLLAYLANRPPTPQAPWRGALGFICAGLLVGMLAFRPEPWRLGVAAGMLALALEGLHAWGAMASHLVPGTQGAGPPIAVVDGSHLEPFSDHPWNAQGITGWNLHLLRSGWLPVVASEWDAELIERAEVLALVAPRRPFSASERAEVQAFLERGGTVLAFAGADQAEALRPLLEPFGIVVPAAYRRPDRPMREPAPMGRYPPLKSEEYYEVLRFVDRRGEESAVAFFARWPFECPPEYVEVQDYEGRPAVAMVPVGQGQLVFIADGGLPLNSALEDAEGTMVGGARENAGFVRWLLKRSTAGAAPRPGLAKPGSGSPGPSSPGPAQPGAAPPRGASTGPDAPQPAPQGPPGEGGRP